ncbi:nucleotidyltransferase domain-containing protein [Thermosynechococcus sp. GLH187]|uniref:nucleotidyltransferase domain-containing protein n=1 Tax=unclassified Thermosynechococcus TaxID=2622553 RepID=UPI0028612B1B|nr:MULTISPECIES: nucleotidyltransferase domain-containing protein [unclassified Thermosynechococcus]MDR7921519.1 nucleotidyltransferase domain-containing protein [Thermosynechococcus sp. HY213]WNC45863.1 nucleotidyltransferase domain-containing protein [Thermosynechococcus sp. GLH187]WNC48399.1 nucleotidyltransferase domain-containing protein [Thermosynechococcus sp. GLH333]WNC50932.1 nucleotidyltransferase domain-containing protein [Thermosynechococcus sp. GLH87]
MPAATIAAIRAILEQEPKVEKAILFGSRAKGMHLPGSDIDLALVGADLNVGTLKRLMRLFEESSILVDLVWLAAVDHPPLGEYIERVGQFMYIRDSDEWQ